MLVVALQFPVLMDVDANVLALSTALSSIEPHALVVAPEGSLSGYEPYSSIVTRLNDTKTRQAIETVRALVEEKHIHLVIGACVKENDCWANSSFYMGPHRELLRYDKVNLAQSERDCFIAGNKLPVFQINVDNTPVRLGIQMCREIRYPEQWRVLATQEAQVIAYVNNAIGSSSGANLWRSHIISRAAEIQRFVVGANNAACDQKCPTLIVSPEGNVMSEICGSEIGMCQSYIDLNNVSNWVIGQSREDIVRVRTVGLRQ